MYQVDDVINQVFGICKREGKGALLTLLSGDQGWGLE